MRALGFAGLVLFAAVGASAGADRKPDRDARQAEELAAELEGRTPGKPRSCLGPRESYGVESFGDSTLLFRISRNLVYRNDVRGRCRDVGRSRALITESFGGGGLCRGDRARSADLVSGFASGFCVLGDFVPYRRN